MTAAAHSSLPARKPPQSVRPKPAKKVDPVRGLMYAEHLTLLALGKACYKRADVILDVLLQHRVENEVVKITSRRLSKKEISKTLREALKLIFVTIEGKNFAIRDKFADRNSIGVGQSARRFEIDEIEVA
jgi:hypothetical protein